MSGGRRREREGGGKRERGNGGRSCYAMTMGTSSEKPLIMGASSSSSPGEEDGGVGDKTKRNIFKSFTLQELNTKHLK